MPLSVIDSTQGPALGSALHAAVAAGAYPDVATAAKAMGRRQRGRAPARSRRTSAAYDELYAVYRELHDHFGRGASGVMRASRRSAGRRTRRHDEDDARTRSPTARRRWPRCTPSSPATASSSGPPATSAPRVPGADLMVIKPSGVSYDDLDADAIVVTDLYGDLVEGERAPSSDTAAHAYVYRHMPQVGGVVHTHSTYATAWAARREPIPCVLTMMADEFGGEVPVGPFALIGDDSIGRGIVETLREQPQQGRADAQPRPVHRRQRRPRRRQGRRDARGRGPHRAPEPPARRAVAARPAEVDALFDRYQNVYGQRRPAVSATYESREIWFLTGSQGLYGDDVLDQVAAHVAARSSRRPGQPRRHPSRGRRQAGAHQRGRDAAGDARRDLGRRVRRRHRVDAHLLAGQDVDRRPRRAAQAAAAPAHPGQPRCPGPRSTWTS